MRKSVQLRLLLVVCAGLLTTNAKGELRNIETGGAIEIYGAYYSGFFSDQDYVVWPNFLLDWRPIGNNGTSTYVDNDGDANATTFIEQRTKLYVRADFTRDISAFVELDSVWTWGEDFRSDWRTGADTRALFNEGNPEIFQSYIEAREVLGHPLTLRIGRQVLAFGDEWLVGSNPDPDPFTETSFDAIRLTYEWGIATVDVWASQLSESGGREQDGDASFFGAYSSFDISPALTLDLYYLFLRDAARVNDTQFTAPLEQLEDVLGLDDYDPSALHTAGVRVAGAWRSIDYRFEAAYQWGEADALGATFRPFGVYGDNEAEFDTWGGVFELGYQFENRYSPRVYFGGHYFGAKDYRDLGADDWLNPFDRSDASVAFNRLFSSYRATHFLDYSALSNYWLIRAGIELALTDRLSASLDVLYHEVVEPFDAPAYAQVGDFRIPVAPALPFLTEEGSDELGVEIMFAPEYRYSEDLTFSMQLVYYFVGDAFEDGVFFDENGTRFIGGTGSDDAVSVTFLTSISF
ncbi:MAG: hypothetical protein AMXMBFR84_15760 [Candidatus Hydrogenedentota bacterium]